MKKTIKLSLFLIIALALSYMGYSIYANMELKKKLATQTPMPEFVFQTLDGDRFTPANLKQEIPVMLVYFNPSCDECIEEAKQLMSHIDWFEDDQIIMVSPADSGALQQFASDFKLAGHPQITVLRDVKNSFLSLFGADVFPSIYAYNKYHKLAMYFRGGTKLQLVYKVMHMEEEIEVSTDGS